MPYSLALQFARAWDNKCFQTGLMGKPNDKDDWIRFECETHVYMRFFDKILTLATPMSTHFLNIEIGPIADVVRLLHDMEITLQTIEYKYGPDIFLQDTYQLRAPPTPLKIRWESTDIPEVSRHAFESDFKLAEVEDRYPPAIFPELYR